jgi:hypothetical protein
LDYVAPLDDPAAGGTKKQKLWFHSWYGIRMRSFSLVKWYLVLTSIPFLFMWCLMYYISIGCQKFPCCMQNHPNILMTFIKKHQCQVEVIFIAFSLCIYSI